MRCGLRSIIRMLRTLKPAQRCIDDQAQLWRLNAYWIISEVQETKKGGPCTWHFLPGCTNPPLSMK